MKKLIAGLAVAALLPLSVQAKTLCFTADGTDYIKFIGVTALKKPGSVSIIKGIWLEGNLVMPLDGTAVTKPDGSIRIGFVVHALTTEFNSNINVEAVVPDSTLVGTYAIDNTGSRDIDSSFSLQAMSCKDFVLP